MLARSSFRTQIAVVVLVALGGLSAVIGGSFALARAALLDEHRVHTANMIESVMSSIADLERRVKVGELSIEEAQKYARDNVENIRYSNKNYFWIFSTDGTLIAHPHRMDEIGRNMFYLADESGKKIYQEFARVVQESGAGYVSYLGRQPGHAHLTDPKTAYVELFQPWGWIIGTGFYVKDVDAIVTRLTLGTAVIGFVALIGFVGMVYWVATGLFRPLPQLTAAINQLARGETDIALPCADYRNHIGRLSRAVWALREAVLDQGMPSGLDRGEAVDIGYSDPEPMARRSAPAFDTGAHPAGEQISHVCPLAHLHQPTLPPIERESKRASATAGEGTGTGDDFLVVPAGCPMITKRSVDDTQTAA